jgi:hypothetical protein
MKTMGGEGAPVARRAVRAEDALRYAMSLPVAVTIVGIDSMKVLRQDLRVARSFVPMTPEEMQALRKQCAARAADGRFETYKTTAKHEGEVGRKQHGFPSPRELGG